LKIIKKLKPSIKSGNGEAKSRTYGIQMPGSKKNHLYKEELHKIKTDANY
jgi:hypothetical protein